MTSILTSLRLGVSRKGPGRMSAFALSDPPRPLWHNYLSCHPFSSFFWHSIFYLTYLLTFFLAYLLTFCLAYLLTFFLTFFLAFYLAYLLTFYLTSFLTFFPLRSGSAHCDLEVAVEVRQWPLRSRSGSAHWDLALAVEVRLCPLGSGLRGGGGRGGGGCGGGGGEQLW